MHPQLVDAQIVEESDTTNRPAPAENKRNDDDLEEIFDLCGEGAEALIAFGKGLIEGIVSYALPMMNTYLTDVWKLSFTKAATIVNVWEGVSRTLPIALAHLSDTLSGKAPIYIITSIAHTIGLGFLSMSTPPVLSNATGTCSDYKPECIGRTQRILFFTSLPLIAVGIAGYIFLIRAFIGKIHTKQRKTSDPKIMMILKASLRFSLLMSYVIMAIIYSAIKPWALRFGIPAINSAANTFCMVPNVACCLAAVNKDTIQVSPMTTMIRVLVASTFKLSEKLPDDPAKLYEEKLPDNPAKLYEEIEIRRNKLISHSRGLRFLDKAAIILQNPSLDEQKKHKWRLCTVTEVEETKIAIRMFPMWITFIICGVITSIGNTYFLEQAKNLNQKIGHLTLPFLLLPLFHKLMKSLIGTMRKYFTPQVGIALAMTCSVLCCIIAALVERRRLHIVVQHGLLDKPDKRIPMSVLWLVPQFIFLAGLDSLLEKSVECLFNDQIPPASIRYLSFFAGGVTGAGIAGGALSVYIVGNVSERGGRRNWFQSTLNTSRLDKYYWTLAALSAINLVFYNLVVMVYPFRKPKQEEMADGIGSAQKYLDDCKCF